MCSSTRLKVQYNALFVKLLIRVAACNYINYQTFYKVTLFEEKIDRL